MERAIEAAVSAGLPRDQAEQIAGAAKKPSVDEPQAELERGGGDRVRGWFESVGWELDEAALRSALTMLGADAAHVDELAAEAAERRTRGHKPAPFKGHRWIVIPHWDGADGFQHYKDRDPIWIKNYRELLASDEYIGLTFHQRGILHGLWLEYAAANRQLTDSTLTLTRRLGGRVTARDLEALNHAGFLAFAASKPLAPRYQSASPEKRRGETPTPSGTASTPPASRTPPAEPLTCPIAYCGLPFKSQAKLDDHLANVHDQAAA